MFGWVARATVGAALFGAAFGGLVQASEPKLPSSTFAEVGAPTSIPYGWVDFCGRRPEECGLGKLTPRDIHLTKQALGDPRQSQRLRQRRNRADQQSRSLGHDARPLDYPTDGKGDCKVYALFKRKQLVDAGFPRSALLMTIVRDQDGEGHAVLTVKTDRGDFVLDNLTDEILPWNETGYRFIKRQAQDDPNVWLAMAGARPASPAATDSFSLFWGRFVSRSNPRVIPVQRLAASTEFVLLQTKMGCFLQIDFFQFLALKTLATADPLHRPLVR